MKPGIGGGMRILALLLFIAGGFTLGSFWAHSVPGSTVTAFLDQFFEFAITGAFTLLMGYVALTGRAGPFSKSIHYTAPGFPAIPGRHGEHSPVESTLKIRLYSDGRLTLDGIEVTPHDLLSPFREAAANGGAVWMFVENGDMGSTPLVQDVLREIGKVNLRLLVGASEDFSDVPPEEDRGAIGPSNLFLYQTQEEYERYTGNMTETNIYLANLELHFDAFFHQRDDSGVFHIVVAIRPNKSRIWLLYPDQYSDDHFAALVHALENQPPPSLKAGVVAFAISKEIPMTDNGHKDFGIPAPTEWADISKRFDKSMSVTEILDVAWPESSN